MIMAVIHSTHVMYTVQPGDTLYILASKFGTTVSEIEKVNFLYDPITDPTLLYPGWKILIPTAQPGTGMIHLTSSNDSLWTISQRYSSNTDVIYRMNQLTQDPNMLYIGQPLLVPAFVYEVEPDERLSTIAEKFNIPIQAIVNANRGRPGFSLDVIYTGYRMIIPHAPE